MARTYQNIRLFPDLTALENIMVGVDAKHPESVAGRAAGHPPPTAAPWRATTARANTLLLAEIGPQWPRRPAGPAPCAYGDQRQLEIARALAIEPVLLLLDEPAAGMNPVESHAMLELIRTLRDRHGLTILLIEHQMRVVMGISERISVLDHGACIAEGTPAEIRRDPAVIAAYLGARAARHGIDALKAPV